MKPVDLIAWDSLRIALGKRNRRRGDDLLVLQKPLVSRVPGRIARFRAAGRIRSIGKIHPHIKPIGLIARLIAAVSVPGNLIVELPKASLQCMPPVDSGKTLPAAT